MGKFIDTVLLSKSTARPVHKERNSVPALVWAAFPGPHTGIIDLCTAGSAIVSGEDENRIVVNSQLFDELASFAHVVVNVGDHAVEGCNTLRLIIVHLGVLWRAMQRFVGSVRRDVRQEGLVFLCTLRDERIGPVEKDVRAESLRSNNFSVVKVGAIEVGIVPHVGCLSDSATTMAIDFGKATVFGAIGVVVS